MKLTPRLTLVFVSYAALLLATVGWLAYQSGRSSLRSAVISELQSTAIEKQAALDSWVVEKQGEITKISVNPHVIESVSELIEAQADSPEAQLAHDRIVTEIHPNITGGEFLTLLIIDPQTGKVIASSDPNEEGKFQEDRPFFINGKLEPYVQNLYYSVTLQRPAMTASAPLHAPDGRLLAVLAGRMDLADMNAIISRRTGLHQTDDNYLVNSSSLFVTQPRFITDPSVLQRGVHTEAVKNCLAQTSSEVDQLDYRDVPTITVYRWLPERELCLIVKLDQAEAFAPARAFGRTVAVFSTLALLAAAGLAVLLARGLTQPILAIQAGAARFGRGELEAKLPETSRDELGQLAHRFNEMAATIREKETQLRGYAEDLELKVEERTKALRDSEERFRSAFEQAAVGIAHVSSKGTFLRLNQRFCEIVGYTQKEMQSLTFQDITHPDDLQTDLEFVRQVLADEIKTYSIEKRYICKDHSIVWVNLTVSLVRSPKGEPKYFIAVVEDISQRKQAEEERRRYAQRLEGVQTIDRAILAAESPQAIARAALPRLRELIPCQRANVVLFDFKRGLARFAAVEMEGELGPGAEESLPLAEFSPFEILERGPVRYVEDLATYDPRPPILDDLLAKGIHCFITAPLIVNGKLLGELNISSTSASAFTQEHLDIAREVANQLAVATQQAYLRQALEHHAEELEERVAERTEELTAANNELEAFSYSVSHDLRAPLRAIDGFSRILLEEYAGTLPDEGSRYLELVRSNTQQMGQLVDDLLAFSRLSRQPLNRQKISPGELVEQALADLKPEQEGRRVEIVIGDLPEFDGDPTLLKQVYVNLLANALKFTRKRESARIEVGSVERDGEQVCFVRDNGVGFDMQYVGKLFHVFQRLHRAEEYEGTGVGLAIIQRIINRHDGRVWVEADVDKGATFYFTIGD